MWEHGRYLTVFRTKTGVLLVDFMVLGTVTAKVLLWEHFVNWSMHFRSVMYNADVRNWFSYYNVCPHTAAYTPILFRIFISLIGTFWSLTQPLCSSDLSSNVYTFLPNSNMVLSSLKGVINWKNSTELLTSQAVDFIQGKNPFLDAKRA